MPAATVHVLGVRHHGPGSARSVAEALEELRPDLVLVEGCPELDRIVSLLGEEDMRPPVAGLVYAVGNPRQALFYPLAEFSPEWVAARWALARDVPVRFCDLAATHQFALASARPDDEPDDSGGAGDGGPGEEPEDVPTPGREVASTAPRPDPIGSLARAAGYDDPERWWEDAVEHRHSGPLERFAAVAEAMAQVREADDRPDDDPDVLENARREAAMRRVLRVALKDVAGAPGDPADDGGSPPERRVVVVCGAWHAPALHPDAFPPAAHDTRLLARLPRVRVAAAWAPWTSARLSNASGYGAGVAAPGWYQHLFSHWREEDPDAGGADVATTWLVRVAHALRGQRLDASTASVVEATRLAGALAAVRGRPSVGLAELDDAAQAVLCDGSRLALDLVHRDLVVGRDLGEVPESAPIVPLAADLARQQRSLRLKPSATATTVTLDLRRPAGLARSVLLHRLALLGIGWAEEVDAGPSTGTFKEAWELEWRPELAVDVVEASVHGTTVAAAAASRVEALAAQAPDLASLGRLVGRCLLADLPEGTRATLRVLADRAALAHDVPALLGTVEPLANTWRYGDVRGADVGEVRRVLGASLTRACVGLPAACASLDDDAAATVRGRIEEAQRGLSLLRDTGAEPLHAGWHDALARISDVDRVHGQVAGRATRLLLDGGHLDAGEAADRMSRRLSLAAPAGQAAAWLDGFLAGDAVLLVHDPVLLGLVDAWVDGVTDQAFEDLVPLLRRTFSAFSAPERRVIGERLSRLDRGPDDRDGGLDPDLAAATPGLVALARHLGWEEVPA